MTSAIHSPPQPPHRAAPRRALPRGAGIVWSIGGGLALLWTGLAALTAAAAAWVGVWLREPAAAMPRALPEPPAWLADWLPAWAWTAALEDLQAAWQTALALLPALGAVAGWLQVLVWLAWAAGLAVLLLVAIALHAWLARSAARPLGAG